MQLLAQLSDLAPNHVLAAGVGESRLQGDGRSAQCVQWSRYERQLGQWYLYSHDHGLVISASSSSQSHRSKHAAAEERRGSGGGDGGSGGGGGISGRGEAGAMQQALFHYERATLLNPSSSIAWHAWALANYEGIGNLMGGGDKLKHSKGLEGDMKASSQQGKGSSQQGKGSSPSKSAPSVPASSVNYTIY